jgi:hypothetical protein
MGFSLYIYLGYKCVKKEVVVTNNLNVQACCLYREDLVNLAKNNIFFCPF